MGGAYLETALIHDVLAWKDLILCIQQTPPKLGTSDTYARGVCISLLNLVALGRPKGLLRLPVALSMRATSRDKSWEDRRQF